MQRYACSISKGYLTRRRVAGKVLVLPIQRPDSTVRALKDQTGFGFRNGLDVVQTTRRSYWLALSVKGGDPVVWRVQDGIGQSHNINDRLKTRRWANTISRFNGPEPLPMLVVC